MRLRQCGVAVMAGLVCAGGVAAQAAVSDQLVVGGGNKARGVTLDACGRRALWEKGWRGWVVE